jgi:ABC-2 type transport system permease protein
MGYLSGVQGAASRRLAPRSAPVLGNGRALTLETRYLFNPTLDTHRFIIPGLIALVTGMLGVLLTALTVAREWETGSMELLLSTPVRPLELVLGKLTPYLALATLAITVVYLLVRVAFSTGFAGSHALFFIAVLLYILLCLSQGLLISVGARNQALAMQLGITTGLLPPMMLSGFIFPVESMPLFFRALTTLLPARWFVTIIRALWLKGSTALELALPFSILLAMTLVLVALAATRLKTDLEP